MKALPVSLDGVVIPYDPEDPTAAGEHNEKVFIPGKLFRELWKLAHPEDESEDETPPADAIFPAVNMAAHAADLGMMFYSGKMFPKKYQNGIFSAQHGSWNRTTPVGARVMFTSLNEDGSANETVPFAEGWLVDETGEYLGRPVDVEQYIDGSILVSDDLVGAIYRISYVGG